MTIEAKVRNIIANFDPEVVKTIVKVIVKTSVAGTVITLVHANTPTYSKAQKVKLYIGAAAMGNMIGEKAADWAYEKLETLVATLKELFADDEATTTSAFKQTINL